jgi:esterase FrsA
VSKEIQMPYQWPVDLELLFAERYPQMVNRGLPPGDVDALRERTTDMWANEPGGWVFEWSRLAEQYVDRGDRALALVAYGYAKFPTLADEHRREAYGKQIELCLAMAAAEPIPFRRRVVEVEHQGARVPVTIHEYSRPDADPAHAPVLLGSGGLDMWKEDLHALWSACVLSTGMSVLAFDVPGTGESTVAMSADSGGVVSGLVREARRYGNGRVAHLGISMGGYFAARTGLAGEVDASVVFGGPVKAAFDRPFGSPSARAMSGVAGGALGFDTPPTDEELASRWTPMSLSGLLDAQPRPTPMLVVNGANDPLIPQEDTLLFEGRPGAEVHLIPDSGHCAAEKVGEVGPMIIGWLGTIMAAVDAA